ncbi:MAG: TIGR03089 family protein [Mycobacteriales bacterium]
MAETPAALLAGALRRDPAGPLLTFYDDATGERTELSATTLANWVAKTANLLTDELDVEAGDPVYVDLPAHWQSAVVLLALWSLGAVPKAMPAGCTLAVADEPSIPAALASGVRDVLGLALAPMNAKLRAAPAGVVDYAAVVLGAGDAFAVMSPSGSGETQAARLRVAQWGLGRGERLLVAAARGLDDAVEWLLAPLASDSSIVLCRHADPVALPRRVADERVSATLGATVEGARRLDS